MARLFTSGFELNSITAGMEWTALSGSPTISTSTVRSGSYALRISSLSSSIAQGLRQNFASAVGDGPFFARFYLRIATAPSGNNTIFRFLGSGPTDLINIELTSGRQLRLMNATIQIGSSSSTLNLNQWYMIEVRFDRSPAIGSEVARAYLDGVEFAGAANLTLSAAVDRFIIGGNLKSELQTQGDWFFDDVAINDSTGSNQNSLPGEGKVIVLKPNAAGDNSQWDGSDGVTDPASPHLYIDEVTPDDATTFLRSRTTNDVTDVNIENSGLTNETINVVHVGLRANRSTGTTSSTFAARLKDSSGGTVTEGSTQTAASTAWRTNDLSIANCWPFNITSYTRPGGSNPWTPATIDSAQIGLICKSGSGDRYVQVTVLYLVVDYASPSVQSYPITKSLQYSANPIAANLKDNFNDNSIDSSKWTTWGAGSVLEQNSQLEITAVSGMANYNALQAQYRVNLTGSSVSIEVKNAGNQSLASFELIMIQLLINPDSDRVSYLISGNNIKAFKTISGSYIQVGSNLAYNSSVHKFFRIRESGGTIYYEWSTDGQSWTTHETLTNPFSVKNLLLLVLAGSWQSEASNSTGIFDNLNINITQSSLTKNIVYAIKQAASAITKQFRYLTKSTPVTNVSTLVNETMNANPSTGVKKNAATWIDEGGGEGFLRLNEATSNTSGQFEYYGVLPEYFEVNFEFLSGGGNGADGVYFYFGNSETPVTEGSATGGYKLMFSEYNDVFQLWFDSSFIASSSAISNFDNSTWHLVKIIRRGNNFKVIYDGALIFDYTDITRSLGGNVYGWGARNGMGNNEHYVRELTLFEQRPALNKPLTYRLVSTVSNVSKQIAYKVRRPASAIGKSTKYTVKTTPAALTKGLIYSVTSATVYSVTKNIAYRVRKAPSTSKSLKYSVKTTPSAIGKTLRYAIKTSASSTKSVSYKVKGLSSLSKSGKYTVKTQQSTSRGVIYRIKVVASALSKSAKYTIRKSQSLTKGVIYKIKAPGSSLSRQIIYRVKAQAYLQKQVRYAVKKALAVTKSLAYNLGGAGVINKTAKYTIKLGKATTKSIVYRIRTFSALNKSVAYSIRRAVIPTKQVRYLIKANSAISKSLVYRVFKTYQTTKSIVYRVRVAPLLSKSVKYTLKSLKLKQLQAVYSIKLTPSAQVKSVDYKLRSLLSLSKPIFYVVKASKVGSRQIRYTIKVGAFVTRPVKYSITKATIQHKALSYIVYVPGQKNTYTRGAHLYDRGANLYNKVLGGFYNILGKRFDRNGSQF